MALINIDKNYDEDIKKLKEQLENLEKTSTTVEVNIGNSSSNNANYNTNPKQIGDKLNNQKPATVKVQINSPIPGQSFECQPVATLNEEDAKLTIETTAREVVNENKQISTIPKTNKKQLTNKKKTAKKKTKKKIDAVTLNIINSEIEASKNKKVQPDRIPIEEKQVNININTVAENSKKSTPAKKKASTKKIATKKAASKSNSTNAKPKKTKTQSNSNKKNSSIDEEKIESLNKRIDVLHEAILGLTDIFSIASRDLQKDAPEEKIIDKLDQIIQLNKKILLKVEQIEIKEPVEIKQEVPQTKQVNTAENSAKFVETKSDAANLENNLVKNSSNKEEDIPRLAEIELKKSKEEVMEELKAELSAKAAESIKQEKDEALFKRPQQNESRAPFLPKANIALNILEDNDVTPVRANTAPKPPTDDDHIPYLRPRKRDKFEF